MPFRYSIQDKKAKKYKSKDHHTLLGIQYNSYTNPLYFWQHTVMNIPFRKINDLKHPQVDRMPDMIQTFACAMHTNNQFWNDDQQLLQLMAIEGNKEYYGPTFVSFVTGYRYLYDLVNMQVVIHTLFSF